MSNKKPLSDRKRALLASISRLRDKEATHKSQLDYLIRSAKSLSQKVSEQRDQLQDLNSQVESLQALRVMLCRDIVDAAKAVAQRESDAAFAEQVRDIARACDASSIAAMERMGLTVKLKQP